MKIVFGFLGTLAAIIATFLFVGFTVTYGLICINFSGPESVVEPCFEIGFGLAFRCALAVGFFLCRFIWIRYSSSEPE